MSNSNHFQPKEIPDTVEVPSLYAIDREFAALHEAIQGQNPQNVVLYTNRLLQAGKNCPIADEIDGALQSVLQTSPTLSFGHPAADSDSKSSSQTPSMTPRPRHTPS